MAAGEGIETMLALRMPLRPLPMIAALSGAHLAAIAWPKPLRRLYVVRDLDAAGDAAWSTLCERACTDDIEIHALMAPTGADMNDALIAMGVDALGRALASQLERQSVVSGKSVSVSVALGGRRILKKQNITHKEVHPGYRSVVIM